MFRNVLYEVLNRNYLTSGVALGTDSCMTSVRCDAAIRDHLVFEILIIATQYD